MLPASDRATDLLTSKLSVDCSWVKGYQEAACEISVFCGAFDGRRPCAYGCEFAHQRPDGTFSSLLFTSLEIVQSFFCLFVAGGCQFFIPFSSLVLI